MVKLFDPTMGSSYNGTYEAYGIRRIRKFNGKTYVYEGIAYGKVESQLALQHYRENGSSARAIRSKKYDRKRRGGYKGGKYIRQAYVIYTRN